jgi:hypothetical protein
VEGCAAVPEVFEVGGVLVEGSVVVEAAEVEGEAAVSEAVSDVFADQGFAVEAEY